ncbi:hypothetical protein PNEG_00890 [Pneumocystis murina B123]|uniref:Cytochrome c oxidase subunit n=1 Tax=Pneumocystis murina (strain B123) TaxID=1069680 RepID=M7NUG3_PNEMU|nr:hypothetical protein PNEG_00890 [Pneumocystis murina B123]EMR10741.1 hypothetical protein PNEG_00890 [Pneumocystis murina B123]
MLWRYFLRKNTLIKDLRSIRHCNYTTEARTGHDFVLEQEIIKKHAGKTADLWKKITIFVCIPALLITSLNAYQLYTKHHSKLSHELEEKENDSTPEYPYQNIRTKRFFWGDGDKTLFWNDRVNKHKISS